VSPGALGDRILYAQSWEDPACARAALRIRPGHTVLAIGAAGDNALALLLDEPARVLAVDVSPAQSALVDLKVAAVRCLGAGEVAPWLGAAPPARGARGDTRPERQRRLDTLDRLRPGLSGEARRFWDANAELVAAGVIHTGRFECYLAVFRRWLLRLVPGRSTVRAMLRAASLEEQRELYLRRWDSPAWRAMVRVFFSRRVLSAFGRHPRLFTYCRDGDVGRHYLARARVGLTEVPIRTNPFVAYILGGVYDRPERTPAYLRPRSLAALAPLAGRIEVRTQSLTAALAELPDRSVDAFYLSDVFELFSESEYAAALEEISRAGRPGARLCYWNNLVDRRRPPGLAHLLESDARLAGALFARDRAFLYSRFVVESVRGAVP
jgi:S-adenosylmethionine:diacylglycerol 3-amino-3-carboxypropyl transferase